MPQTTPAATKEDRNDQGGIGHTLSRLRSYFFFTPLVWFYTAVLGCLSLLSSFFDREGRLQHGFARLWSKMILGTLGIPVEIIGLEKIDTSKAHIYAVNHLSAVDIPVLYAHLPFQFRILAKKELFRYPFMGWHLRRSGQIPVDQDSIRGSARSLGRAVAGIRQGMPILIFPEGGRSESGQLQGFMNGAFYLAIKAQVDIVPMAIVGTYEILRMNTFHIKPAPVQLVFGDPISSSGMTLRELDALTERARQAIADLYYSRSPLPDLRDEYLERKESEK